MKYRIFQVLGGLFVLGCPIRAESAVVTVLNELGRSEPGYILKVKSVYSVRGPVSGTFRLEPGESKLLSAKPIKSFTVLRDYGQHAKVYEVRCPEPDEDEITLKLIDIHSNRMPGGCKLTRKGTYSSSSGTTWDD